MFFNCYFLDLLDSETSAMHTTTQSLHAEVPVRDVDSLQSVLRKRHSIPVQIGIHPGVPVQGSAGSSGSYGEYDQQSHHVGTSEMDSEVLLREAIVAFRNNLGLEDDSDLRDIIHLKDVPAGAYLTKEESQHVCALL